MADTWRRIATDLLERAQNITRDRESRLIDEATFGAECSQLLDSAPFREFMARAEARITDEMLKAPIKDDDLRLRLSIAVHTQRQWAEFLIKSAQAGRLAEVELEKLRKGRERVSIR